MSNQVISKILRLVSLVILTMLGAELLFKEYNIVGFVEVGYRELLTYLLLGAFYFRLEESRIPDILIEAFIICASFYAASPEVFIGLMSLFYIIKLDRKLVIQLVVIIGVGLIGNISYSNQFLSLIAALMLAMLSIGTSKNRPELLMFTSIYYSKFFEVQEPQYIAVFQVVLILTFFFLKYFKNYNRVINLGIVSTFLNGFNPLVGGLIYLWSNINLEKYLDMKKMTLLLFFVSKSFYFQTLLAKEIVLVSLVLFVMSDREAKYA